jgi:uncharacterized protein (TIGR02266 family)
VPTQDAPLVRIQLRYPDEATFVQRFAPNVTRGGIFLASRTPHPVGTVIAFEVAIMQGPPLLFGTGKVSWVREFNLQEPHRAHGMGVQFLQVAPSCRPMLDRLLLHKNQPPRYTPTSGLSTSDSHPGHEGVASQIPAELEGDPSTWIDDQALRVAIDRARVFSSRIEDVETLRTHDPEAAPPTLEEALAQLPRLLDQRH